jgi:hypothetical protein
MNEARSLSTLFLVAKRMPAMDLPNLRLIVATLGLLLCAGCATTGGTPGPAAPAPTYQVGDRWVYRVQDGFGRMRVTWEETHQITAVSPQGVTLRVSGKGPSIDEQRTESWSGPGVVLTGAVFDNETRRFEPPLVRYQFPLTGGTRWSQHLRDLNNQEPGPYGGVNRTVSVGGYEKITTPAGTFDAIRLQVYMRLDDETFWRWPTDCVYTLWYSPALGMTVREEKYAHYIEKGGGINGGNGRFESQRATVELVSSTRGR